MKTSFCLISLLLLAGCSTIAGPMGAYEGSFSCKGKVALTGTGALTLGAGYGGGGSGNWTIQGDCGEGFAISRSRERTPIELPPAQ